MNQRNRRTRMAGIALIGIGTFVILVGLGIWILIAGGALGPTFTHNRTEGILLGTICLIPFVIVGAMLAITGGVLCLAVHLARRWGKGKAERVGNDRRPETATEGWPTVDNERRE